MEIFWKFFGRKVLENFYFFQKIINRFYFFRKFIKILRFFRFFAAKISTFFDPFDRDDCGGGIFMVFFPGPPSSFFKILKKPNVISRLSSKKKVFRPALVVFFFQDFKDFRKFGKIREISTENSGFFWPARKSHSPREKTRSAHSPRIGPKGFFFSRKKREKNRKTDPGFRKNVCSDSVFLTFVQLRGLGDDFESKKSENFHI